MNIILEGPDGSGKTTLAKQLADMLGMTIEHFEYPGDNVEQYPMFHSFMTDRDNTIIDRAWYSDMCYGPVFRDGARIDVSRMHALEQAFPNTVLIYCTGDPALMYESARDRGEDYVETYKQYKEVHKLYEKYMRNTEHFIPVHIREAKWLS